MNRYKQYCINCTTHTEHLHMVDRYATQCTRCNLITSQMQRMDTESNVLLTPDGDKAVVVRNDKDNTTFFIEDGKDAGYYFYDKNTGFGAVQKLGNV